MEPYEKYNLSQVIQDFSITGTCIDKKREYKDTEAHKEVYSKDNTPKDLDNLPKPPELSQWDKAHIVMAVIAELESKHEGVAPVAEVYTLSMKKGLDQAFLDVFIGEEKNRGRLYEPKLGCLARAVKGSLGLGEESS